MDHPVPSPWRLQCCYKQIIRRSWTQAPGTDNQGWTGPILVATIRIGLSGFNCIIMDTGFSCLSSDLPAVQLARSQSARTDQSAFCPGDSASGSCWVSSPSGRGWCRPWRRPGCPRCWARSRSPPQGPCQVALLHVLLDQTNYVGWFYLNRHCKLCLLSCLCKK